MGYEIFHRSQNPSNRYANGVRAYCINLFYYLFGNGYSLPFSAENVTTHVSTRIHFPKIQNEEVMVASTMKVEFSLAVMRVHLSNLFNGNQVLGEYRRGVVNYRQTIV